MSNAMFREASRLASFKPRRRSSVASNSKGASAQKWPHLEPSPKSLAAAGFFYNPTDESPDNVTCYLCEKSLDGWEAGDNPISEHIRHSKTCGWAITASLLAEEDDSKIKTDPNGKAMKKARQMTFGDLWPYEGKTGWNPSVQKMVDGGWVYAPAKDSDDKALCPYCQVSLDGWEQEDDPWMEHSKRAPGCLVFNWKPKRGGRGSRASQVSVMSVATDASQSIASSRAGSEAPEEEPAPKPKKGRKASVTKKPTAKKGGRTKKATSREPSVESVLEPEVLVEPPKKGRKRASSVVDNEPVVIYDGGKDTDEEKETKPPPPKRRAMRSSIVQQSSVDLEGDLSITDIVPASASKPRGKRQASTTKKRTSTRNASKAWTPDDEDIDRALALDLERPLSDEEDFTNFKKPFVRKTKRTMRSRTSLLVDQEMKDAPDGILLPTANKERRSKTPAVDPEIGKTPFKSFFKEQDQDFSLPVKVPKHLADGEEEPEQYKSPVKKKQEKVAEAILRNYSAEPVEVGEEDVAPKPAVKKGRARKKAAVEAEPDEEKPKPKRGRPAKGKGRVASSQIEDSTPSAVFEPEIVVEEAAPAPVSEVVEELPKPKRGRKPKQQKPVEQPRHSAVSLVSIVSDDTPVDTVDNSTSMANKPQTVEADDEKATDSMDVGELSDAGSVVHHEIEHPQSEATEVDVIEPAEKSSIVEVETKAEKAPTKKATTKKEKAPLVKRGKRTKVARAEEVVEPEAVASPSNADVDMPSHEDLFVEDTSMTAPPPMEGDKDGVMESPESVTAKESMKVAVSFAEHVAEEHAGSEEEYHEEPTMIDSRPPLSPVHRQVRLKSPSTPSNGKIKLTSSNPWTAVDVDTVFAVNNVENDEPEKEEMLTAAEKDMTVEQWIKSNAVDAETRTKNKAEKLVELFEQSGMRAIAAIEGIPTV